MFETFKKAILPKGFRASGLACGLKKSGKLDLALFYSEVPAKLRACSPLIKFRPLP
jgi:N-acetylglutamate synthase/N-acetylornithine aminotransferase